MSVLVTGASGFVGRRVVPLLAGGPLGEVIVATRDPTSMVAMKGVRVVALDLLDREGLATTVRREAPSHLLHLAWYAAPGQFWTAIDNLDQVAATLMLYRAFADAGGRRMVAVGSCAEYDWTGAGTMHEHSTPLAPATLYGVAKDATRRVLIAASARGPSVAWGRIFWTYGPGEKRGRLVSDVAAALVRGDSATCGPGTELRDFLHVDDVAGALVAALHATATGCFNIGSGTSTAVRDMALALARIAGHPDRVRFAAPQTAAPAVPEVVADIGRLRDEIGFSPSIGLEEGLRSTFAWWRGHVDAVR